MFAAIFAGWACNAASDLLSGVLCAAFAVNIVLVVFYSYARRGKGSNPVATFALVNISYFYQMLPLVGSICTALPCPALPSNEA